MNWKDIKNYKGLYQISDTGLVKSLPKYKLNKNGGYWTNERILKGCKNKNGYITFSLRKNKIKKVVYAHHLVAEAFLNHEVKGYKKVIDHIDENPSNNNLSNLRIISNRKNISRGFKNKHSKYIGVTYDKTGNRYLSRIRNNGKIYNLGSFKNEYDAHLAYQNRLKQYENLL